MSFESLTGGLSRYPWTPIGCRLPLTVSLKKSHV